MKFGTGEITHGSKSIITFALPFIMILSLTARWPVAGQQLPPDATDQTTAATVETAAELQQLVAPIALYPDALVAQILAAATYPTQVVQADRWLQQRPNLQGEEIAALVDQQPWDPSVKAMTAFPSVLANLDKNLSWTEALGNAYYNQQQDVLNAVQVMRRRAEDAGNLRSTPQEAVVSQGATIVIQPVEPDFCYLPIYDPWIVYGRPVAVYPGYFYGPLVGSSFISFGPAIRLGYFGGFGWGWPAWGFNWDRRVVVFNHSPYFSRSRYFSHRDLFGAGHVSEFRRSLPPARAGRSFNSHTAAGPNPRAGNGWASRSSVQQRTNSGYRSGAFNSARSGGVSPALETRGGLSSGRSGLGGGRRLGGGMRSGRSVGGPARGNGGGRHR